MVNAEILRLVRKAKEKRIDGTYTLSASGAIDRLLKEFEPDIKRLVANLYISGADSGDVVQEGRIGFVKAIHDYKEDSNMSFKNFALNFGVRRHVITCINAAQRKKFELHKNAVWISTPISNDNGDAEQTLEDFIADKNSIPLDDLLLVEEQNSYIYDKMIAILTPMEKQIFIEYLENPEQSYKEISSAISSNPKAVDNGLMRIRKKLRHAYEAYLNETEYDDY